MDAAGSVYITGQTRSTQATFPVTVGPDLSHNAGAVDAFVAKVKPDGTGLVYCGYIGGSNADYATAIAVDGSGNAYVTGYTMGTVGDGFPVLVGPDLTPNGNYDAFVAKVNASGASLAYCGYIGGTARRQGEWHRRGWFRQCLCHRPSYQCGIPHFPRRRRPGPDAQRRQRRLRRQDQHLRIGPRLLRLYRRRQCRLRKGDRRGYCR